VKAAALILLALCCSSSIAHAQAVYDAAGARQAYLAELSAGTAAILDRYSRPVGSVKTSPLTGSAEVFDRYGRRVYEVRPGSRPVGRR
jgi:hypothetical protein